MKYGKTDDQIKYGKTYDEQIDKIWESQMMIRAEEETTIGDGDSDHLQPLSS